MAKSYGFEARDARKIKPTTFKHRGDEEWKLQ
jgi:hypothetical protein